MPLYTYEAANINGNVIKGKLSADNEEDLMRTLRKKGFFLKECSEASGKLDLDLAMFRKIPEKDLSVFCREIYFSLSSGISIMEALKIVKDQLENKKLRWVTERVYEDVEGGSLLSDAFKKTNEMPDLFIYMIEVGETTGSLDEIMNELSDYYDKQYKQGRKIANALIYPKFLIIFSLVIVSILVAYVVPIFVNNLLSANGELPIPTKIVI
ncbi:MAG: type II secretion system F family protein, partial [Clostridium sp.]